MKKLLLLLLLVSALLVGCDDQSAHDYEEEPEEDIEVVEGDLFDVEEYCDEYVDTVSTDDSSCFSMLSYDRKGWTLVAEFRESGAMYVYYDVPEGVWNELKNAPSKGSYYNAHIKGYYDYDNLDELETW